MTGKRDQILAWLDEQEALCEAATKGPWWAPEPGRTAYGRLEVWARDRRSTIICEIGGGPSNADSVADQALIAASRTVLPQALAALRGEVEAHYCDGCSIWRNYIAWPCTTIERIHAATVGAK